MRDSIASMCRALDIDFPHTGRRGARLESSGRAAAGCASFTEGSVQRGLCFFPRVRRRCHCLRRLSRLRRQDPEPPGDGRALCAEHDAGAVVVRGGAETKRRRRDNLHGSMARADAIRLVFTGTTTRRGSAATRTPSVACTPSSGSSRAPRRGRNTSTVGRRWAGRC